MIGSIIDKEIKENLLSYKFTIIIILSTLLILTSIFIMYRDYQLRFENYEILQPESGEPAAIIPPTPLSLFAKGLDENLCRSYEIQFGGQIRVGSKQQSVNTLFQLFTTPDLLYVVKIILSLCALLFAYDMISGEKEAGTLRLSLGNNVGRTKLIIGKWIGGFTSFIFPFLIVVLLGALLVSLSPQVRMNGENWTRLGMFMFTCTLYLAIFFSLGLLISSLTHQVASSLVFSLLIWTILVFVIPNLGNILARQFVEIPTVQQLEVKREHIWIKEVFDLNRDMRRVNEQAPRMEIFQRTLSNINSENDELIVDYRNRFNRLVTLTQNITRFPPAATFTFLATDLAGTGIIEEQRLKQSILNYKNVIWDKPIDSGGNLIGDFPPFSFQRSSIREVFNLEGLNNLLILVLFNALFFVSAYVAFLRYDVR